MRAGGPVWIDLANSPHVLFFEPVIAELQHRGVEVRVTARGFAQTVELARRLPVPVDVLGSHGGATLSGKMLDLIHRVDHLRRWARDSSPSVAVSHNSYSQTLAARSLGLSVMTAMDYEFQPANHLAFRCADLVAVPDSYPIDALCGQGARPDRTWRYPGLKEEISLAGFSADPDYLAGVGVDTSKPVVFVRPPADTALYHRFQNKLFGTILERLLRDEHVTGIVLARTPSQAAELEDEGCGALLWRGDVLDGRQLVAGADMVISAGGSMIREAAVLGTPACSVFAGRVGAVDRTLVAGGRLRLLSSKEDVDALDWERKPAKPPVSIDTRLVGEFVKRVLRLRDRRSR